MKNNRISSLTCVAIVMLIMIVALGVVFALGTDNEADGQKAIAAKGVDSKDVINILALGRDDAAQLCDVVLLASINLSSREFNVLQIPRDTLFEYGNEQYGKINAAPRMYGSVSAFKDALSEALGVNINYYLAFDLNTVAELVDTLSGVEIDVPMDMDYEDSSQNLSIHLKAGKQFLNGEQAIQYLRYRSGYITGDLGRMDAHKTVLNAFAKRIEESGNSGVMLKLLKVITSKSETNLTDQSLFSIMLKCAQNKPGATYYVTAPGEAIRSEQSGAWYYVLSRSSNAELLSEKFGLQGDKNDFDKSNKFVDKRVKSFYDIYNKRCEYKIYSAKDVDNNLININ